MRDILIFGIICAGSATALFRPWIGVIVWTWVSIMNPHALGWGFITTMPVAQMVAIGTLLGLLFTKDKRNPFTDSPVIFFTLFVVWMCIGWPLSLYPSDSWDMLKRVLKIDVMVIVTIALVYRREHIHWFLWTIVFSLGFYGVKGGIFTIMTGGSHRVWGPGGFIEGNNEIALAMIITIPLMYYILSTVPPQKKLIRYVLVLVMVLTAAASLGSQSRGALLALASMGAFLWWRSERKGSAAILLSLVAISLIAFMPSTWVERMNTIESYERDSSAMGRINAWLMAFNLANDRPIFGGGFEIYTADIFAKYAPDPLDIHAAHSIYFQILGEHGWIGLGLWLLIFLATWRIANTLRRLGNIEDGTEWCKVLGSMCQVSLIGYAVGGAFLSLAYFDLPYNLMAIVVGTRACLIRCQAARESAPRGATRG
jgi:putative inorganic carbon (hco3(-)) transporter